MLHNMDPIGAPFMFMLGIPTRTKLHIILIIAPIPKDLSGIFEYPIAWSILVVGADKEKIIENRPNILTIGAAIVTVEAEFVPE